MAFDFEQFGFDKDYLRTDLNTEDGSLVTTDSTNLSSITTINGSLQSQNFLDSVAGYYFGEDNFQINGGGTISGDVIIGGSISGSALHIPDKNTTSNSFHVDTDGNTWWGATEPDFTSDNNNAVAYVLKDGTAKFQNVALNNSVTINDIQSGSEISIQGWQHDMTFSASDSNTVAWSSGTITLTDGTTYSITGANTGNMSARTFIYLDIGTSTTALQTTTTASSAVGSGKILIAVAEDSTNEAIFQVFNGNGGIKITGSDIENESITANQITANTITADLIAANTITANEIASNTITANEIAATTITATEMNVGNLASITADLGSITAGDITLDSSGFIKGGQTAYNTGTGFFLGYNTSAYKLSIGNPSGDYLTWDGSELVVNGTKLAKNDIYGDGSDGDVTISSNTNLSKDMYYNNLTINTGITLNSNGYRIFVAGTLTTTGTGKIISNGNDGSNGQNSSGSSSSPGGSGGAAAYTIGTLPLPEDGKSGGNGSGTGTSTGGSGTNGDDVEKALIENSGVAGGNGGDGTNGSGGSGGAGGSNTTNIYAYPRIFTQAYNLFEFDGGTLKLFTCSPGSGGGGGGGPHITSEGGGGGGGSASTGGCIFVAFKQASGTINIEAIGGNGGDGGSGSGGGGGGAGGNGGIIIAIHQSGITLNTDVSGGLGGSGGGGTENNGDPGSDGNDGIVIELET